MAPVMETAMEMEAGTALVTVMVMAQVKRSATTAWMTALEMPLALAMVAASETVPDTGKVLVTAQDRGRARFVFSRAIGAHHRNRPRSALIGYRLACAAGCRSAGKESACGAKFLPAPTGGAGLQPSASF